MRILDLSLKNIGPFREATLSFGEEIAEKMPVTIITGENGTGKTIVLDAIRGLFLGNQREGFFRNIVREKNSFFIKAHLAFQEKISPLAQLSIGGKRFPASNGNNTLLLETHEQDSLLRFEIRNYTFSENFVKNVNQKPANWITNYWTGKTSSENLKVEKLVSPVYEDYLINSLDGIQKNVEVAELICFFDYLKSSDDPKEKKEGEFLFNILKKIVKLSLIEGEFQYVERKTLTPIVSQMGFPVSLDKLSSGNLCLVQRLVSLLGQMYAIHSLLGHDLADLCKTPGLLMIDEAENHLHPKWQKTFLHSILEIFPYLQIIVTTHSPFIVASVPNARIYVCKSMGDHSVIVDETAEYSNKPIEEILLSPVFNTQPFNTEISTLIMERKKAIEGNDIPKKNQIEAKLKALNPQHFAYFEVEKLLAELSV